MIYFEKTEHSGLMKILNLKQMTEKFPILHKHVTDATNLKISKSEVRQLYISFKKLNNLQTRSRTQLQLPQLVYLKCLNTKINSLKHKSF